MEPMKRKRGDRAGWVRVIGPKYRQMPIDGGLLAAIHVPAVREPLWVDCCGERVRIVDAGYTRVSFFPEGARHVLTTQFDARGEPAQWYVDIVYAHGMGEDGVPWYDDLYLDVVSSPRGGVDELDVALANGLVTHPQAESAWHECRTVVAALREGTFGPVLASRAHLRALHAAGLTEPRSPA